MDIVLHFAHVVFELRDFGVVAPEIAVNFSHEARLSKAL